jgi:uncharacterized protein (UPF0147 family)
MLRGYEEAEALAMSLLGKSMSEHITVPDVIRRQTRRALEHMKREEARLPQPRVERSASGRAARARSSPPLFGSFLGFRK